jgi:hypothetical protein
MCHKNLGSAQQARLIYNPSKITMDVCTSYDSNNPHDAKASPFQAPFPETEWIGNQGDGRLIASITAIRDRFQLEQILGIDTNLKISALLVGGGAGLRSTQSFSKEDNEVSVLISAVTNNRTKQLTQQAINELMLTEEALRLKDKPV